MLYLSFRFILFFTSFFGILSMISTDNIQYLYFPIIMLIWVLYTFFREEDEEYKKRNGYYYRTNNSRNRNYSSYDSNLSYYGVYNNFSPQSYKQEYKKIAKKCKRTLKITLVDTHKDEKK